MLLLQHTCDIYRNQAVGTNGRKAKALLTSNVRATFLPMSAEASIKNGYSVGNAYDVYFGPGTDIKVGDRLKRDSDNYAVSAVIPFEGFGQVSHIQVIATREALV